MTPFKQHEHRSMSFTSCESSSVDNDDVPMDECACANAYASPPRSASCLDASSRRKELFGGANTPKTRLLFGEDLEDEVRRSPLPYNARRALKPLDPLDSNNLNDSSESASTLSSSSVQGRKRSSAERRGEHHHETPGCMKMGERDESSTGGVLPIYESPRISPNSFLTMDGRFVQSKNPFSSPMMTDTPTLQHQQQLMMGTTQAPSLPVSFYGNQLNETSADAKFSPGFLPPRHHHHALLQPKQGTPVTEATAGLHAFSLSGYPEHAHNGFTCSPIPEQGPVVPNNTRRPHTSNMMLMESTDTASAGSLHKVRRIHLSDDVVAATGHHLFNLAQRVTDHPEVDTSYMFMDQDNENNDGISPTDVLHFPSFPTPVVLKSGPPPTPVKQRPSKQPYSSNHRPPRTPGPPLLARKAGLRTPHHSLSSYMPGDESVTDTGLSNSRFYSDFDIIGELGHGSFGTVYKVLSRLDGCMYAIKAAQRQAKGVADRDRMLKEVRQVTVALKWTRVSLPMLNVYPLLLVLSCFRSTHWRHFRIKPTRPIFTLSATIKLGWRTIVSTFKLNFVVAHWETKWQGGF